MLNVRSSDLFDIRYFSLLGEAWMMLPLRALTCITQVLAFTTGPLALYLQPSHDRPTLELRIRPQGLVGHDPPIWSEQFDAFRVQHHRQHRGQPILSMAA